MTASTDLISSRNELGQEGGRTRPEKLKGSVEVIFSNVRKNVLSLRSYLLVRTQYNNKKPML